jgi:hypothetical protein
MPTIRNNRYGSNGRQSAERLERENHDFDVMCGRSPVVSDALTYL